MPDERRIEEPCSRHFRFQDLIECGETWHRLNGQGAAIGLNVPLADESWEGLAALCRMVLDPVVDAFGPLVLTYGFASRALTKHVNGAIAPSLDQHVGSERTRTGRLACDRAGQSVDFYVPGVDAGKLARWVVSTTPFDRAIVYEPDRPIHVSVGPQAMKQVVWMRRGASGRRMPRVLSASQLERLWVE